MTESARPETPREAELAGRIVELESELAAFRAKATLENFLLRRAASAAASLVFGRSLRNATEDVVAAIYRKETPTSEQAASFVYALLARITATRATTLALILLPSLFSAATLLVQCNLTAQQNDLIANQNVLMEKQNSIIEPQSTYLKENLDILIEEREDRVQRSRVSAATEIATIVQRAWELRDRCMTAPSLGLPGISIPAGPPTFHRDECEAQAAELAKLESISAQTRETITIYEDTKKLSGLVTNAISYAAHARRYAEESRAQKTPFPANPVQQERLVQLYDLTGLLSQECMEQVKRAKATVGRARPTNLPIQSSQGPPQPSVRSP